MPALVLPPQDNLHRDVNIRRSFSRAFRSEENLRPYRTQCVECQMSK